MSCSLSPNHTVSCSLSPNHTVSCSPSPNHTVSCSLSPNHTVSCSLSPNHTVSCSLSPNHTVSCSLSPNHTVSCSLSPNHTVSCSLSPNHTVSCSLSPNHTVSCSPSPNHTVSCSLSPNHTVSCSPSPNHTVSCSLSPNHTVSCSLSPNHTVSCSLSPNHTVSCSLSPNHTVSCSLSPNHTVSCSLSPNHTVSCSLSPKSHRVLLPIPKSHRVLLPIPKLHRVLLPIPKSHRVLLPIPKSHRVLLPIPKSHRVLLPIPKSHRVLLPIPKSHRVLLPIPKSHRVLPPIPKSHRVLLPIPKSHLLCGPHAVVAAFVQQARAGGGGRHGQRVAQIAFPIVVVKQQMAHVARAARGWPNPPAVAHAFGFFLWQIVNRRFGWCEGSAVRGQHAATESRRADRFFDGFCLIVGVESGQIDSHARAVFADEFLREHGRETFAQRHGPPFQIGGQFWVNRLQRQFEIVQRVIRARLAGPRVVVDHPRRPGNRPRADRPPDGIALNITGQCQEVGRRRNPQPWQVVPSLDDVVPTDPNRCLFDRPGRVVLQFGPKALAVPEIPDHRLFDGGHEFLFVVSVIPRHSEAIVHRRAVGFVEFGGAGGGFVAFLALADDVVVFGPQFHGRIGAELFDQSATDAAPFGVFVAVQQLVRHVVRFNHRHRQQHGQRAVLASAAGDIVFDDSQQRFGGRLGPRTGPRLWVVNQCERWPDQFPVWCGVIRSTDGRFDSTAKDGRAAGCCAGHCGQNQMRGGCFNPCRCTANVLAGAAVVAPFQFADRHTGGREVFTQQRVGFQMPPNGFQQPALCIFVRGTDDQHTFVVAVQNGPQQRDGGQRRFAESARHTDGALVTVQRDEFDQFDQVQMMSRTTGCDRCQLEVGFAKSAGSRIHNASRRCGCLPASGMGPMSRPAIGTHSGLTFARDVRGVLRRRRRMSIDCRRI